jgi:hypothetical protein
MHNVQEKIKKNLTHSSLRDIEEVQQDARPEVPANKARCMSCVAAQQAATDEDQL